MIRYTISSFILPTALFIAFTSPALGNESSPFPIQNSIREKARTGNFVLPFIANEGSNATESAFTARTLSGTVTVTTSGKVVHTLATPGKKEHPTRSMTIVEELLGGHVATVQGRQVTTTKVNFFHGNDPSRWRQGVPAYRQVSLGEVYPGIAVDLFVRDQTVEKIFTVNAQAKPEHIRLRLQGGKDLHVNAQGELAIETPSGTVKFSKPIAYQEENGWRQPVEVAYVVENDEYGFTLGPYDQTKPLVIDPILAATFLGGSKGELVGEAATALVLDSAGNVYVAGRTVSVDFPGVGPGAADADPDSALFPYEAFIAKLDGNLGEILSATFLGGKEFDQAFDVTLDSVGNVYVTGNTDSPDFPGITVASADSTLNGADLFIAKLDNQLSHILAATFVGGTGNEPFRDYDQSTHSLALDSSGNVYVAGTTDSPDFPQIGLQSADSAFEGGSEVFVAKLSADLTTIRAATFLGGSGARVYPTCPSDCFNALVLDAAGNVYVAGATWSSDFPGITANSADPTHGQNAEPFVAKLSPDLRAILAATFLSGENERYWWEEATALALDNLGHVYVTGRTCTPDFPGISPTSADSVFGEQSCTIFIARLDTGLSIVQAASFLGDNTFDNAYALALDSSNNIYVAGDTSSLDFPGIGFSSSDSTLGGFGDAFVAKFDGELHTLLGSTFLGGKGFIGWEQAYALACDSGGNVYVAGMTDSPDFPGITPDSADGVFDLFPFASSEGFVVKLNFAESSFPPPLPGVGLTLPTGGRIAVELLTADPELTYTLSLSSPTSMLTTRGCQTTPPNGVVGFPIVSGPTSELGCRSYIDASAATGSEGMFVPGTTLEFTLCIQSTPSASCTVAWSSDPTRNPDHAVHLRITPLHQEAFPDRIFQLGWETGENGGDGDFTDVIVIVRVGWTNILDADGDGLWDDWELYGVDANGDGIVDLDLKFVASSLSPDVFVEIDYMDCNVAGGDCDAMDTHNHQPKAMAIEAVKRTLSFYGIGGVNLHVDVDEALPHRQFFSFSQGDFEHIKAQHLNPSRRLVYHYGLFIHQQSEHPLSSGQAELPGNDFLASFGGWNRTKGNPDIDGDGLNDVHVGTVQQQAGTFMHELGHNLGLRHGGEDDIRDKPNYPSVMNYTFQLKGLPPVPDPSPPAGKPPYEDPIWQMSPDAWTFFTDGFSSGLFSGYLTYSTGFNASLNETNLDEQAGLCMGPGEAHAFCQSLGYTGSGLNVCASSLARDIGCHREFYVRYRCTGKDIVFGSEGQRASGLAGIDWNCNHRTTDHAHGDINGDGEMGILRDSNDWAHLHFDFHSVPNSSMGENLLRAAVSTDPPELDLAHLTTTLSSDKDNVAHQTATTNDGASSRLLLSKNDRPAVGFDLALLPSPGVTKATLVLTAADAAKDWGEKGGFVSVHRLRESFSEDNVVQWKIKKQGKVTDRVKHTNALKIGDTVEWDVTEDVQKAIREHQDAIAWLLTATGKGQALYYSQEGSLATLGDLSLAPRLFVRFD